MNFAPLEVPRKFVGALEESARLALPCWWARRLDERRDSRPMSSAEQPQPAKPVLHECLPKAGLVYSRQPERGAVKRGSSIKSITLEKLEQMEAAAARGSRQALARCPWTTEDATCM